MSTTTQETEITVYAKLDDPQSLNEAELIEDHIQLEQTLLSGARIRVRKITPIKGGPENGGDRYEITMKEKLPDDGGIPSSNETTQETDENFYNHFAEVAERGIVKRRFVFMGRAPVVRGAEEELVLPAVKYEVDLFTNPKTKQKVPYIKIDIEIDQILDVLKEKGIDITGVRQSFNLKNLPFIAEDMFSPKNATPEQKQLLDNLWENEIVLKCAPNEYVKKQDETQTLPSEPAQNPVSDDNKDPQTVLDQDQQQAEASATA